MSAAISRLNLDSTQPVSDAYYDGPFAAAGVIRFIDAGDPNKIAAMQRMQGDFVFRSKLVEGKINEIIGALTSNPNFITFDDSVFAKVDGSNGFNAPVAGKRPTASDHLVTKDYADEISAATNVAVTELSEALTSINQTTVHYSPWTSHTWQGGIKQVISLAVSPAIADIDKVVSISLVEKLDVSVATVGNPDPDPRWIQRQLTIGSRTGTVIDDMWLEGNTVKIAFPNAAFYHDGYAGYEDIWPVSTRLLRVSVIALK